MQDNQLPWLRRLISYIPEYNLAWPSRLQMITLACVSAVVVRWGSDIGTTMICEPRMNAQPCTVEWVQWENRLDRPSLTYAVQVKSFATFGVAVDDSWPLINRWNQPDLCYVLDCRPSRPPCTPGQAAFYKAGHWAGTTLAWCLLYLFYLEYFFPYLFLQERYMDDGFTMIKERYKTRTSRENGGKAL